MRPAFVPSRIGIAESWQNGYCTGLENRRPKGHGGSNPSLSAFTFQSRLSLFNYLQAYLNSKICSGYISGYKTNSKTLSLHISCVVSLVADCDLRFFKNAQAGNHQNLSGQFAAR